jgi:hypothetical protein
MRDATSRELICKRTFARQEHVALDALLEQRVNRLQQDAFSSADPRTV